MKGYAEKVEVYADGMLIASHVRCFGKHQSVYDLKHYLPLLEQRGRAILNAAPVRQELNLSRYDGNLSDLFVNELASCKFISEKKNVVMIGNPGRGKTHMAVGLGLKVCALGMSVLFKNAATLSSELAEAKDNYVLGKLEKRIRQADLLIQDEMSYVRFDRFQSELLFKAISDRSERGSVIVTTNLPFSQWTELFENTAMVAALVVLCPGHEQRFLPS